MIRHLFVSDAIDPRALKVPRLERFDLAHRGLYEFAEVRSAGEILRDAAEKAFGVRLRPAPARAIRFRPGGYSLVYDDALNRIERGVEVTLDLSAAGGGPGAVYQRAGEALLVPQRPGLLTIVERTSDTYRYDRYLPLTGLAKSVVLLRGAFPYAD